MKKTLLKDDISECCGCFACKDVCPKDAIAIARDKAGFLYPAINDEKCVSCGLCSKICGYKTEYDGNKPEKVYAAASKSSDILMNAASGGLFSVMAETFVKKGGVVCGSAMIRTEAGFEVKHVFVDEEKELKKLAGSKYVKSSTAGVFKEAENILKSGKKLLFSGTPCQIAALKSFLRKDYDSLTTVDLICHGVPSLKLFNDYIRFYEKKNSCEVIDFRFRDKSRGQGMSYRITEKSGEKLCERVKNGKLSSYFGMFLKSSIYMENCYSCPYASEERVSDVTIGDYWGIYQEYADEITKAGLDNRKGISCVLINTDKGCEFWDKINGSLNYFESEFEKVAAHNDQLRNPSSKAANRKKVLRAYVNSGYKAVDEIYSKEIRIKKYPYILEFYMPKSLKRNLKKAVSNIRNKGRKQK